MTVRKVYVGSKGPFLYEDTDPINDVDGDFSGENLRGLATHQILLMTAPSSSGEVVRIDELEIDARRYSVLASPTAGVKTEGVREKFAFRYNFMLR